MVVGVGCAHARKGCAEDGSRPTSYWVTPASSRRVGVGPEGGGPRAFSGGPLGP